MSRETPFDDDLPEDSKTTATRRERSAKHQARKKPKERQREDGFRSRRQALRGLEREPRDGDWEEDDEELDPEDESAVEEEDEDEDLEDIPDDVAAELWDEDWDDEDDDVDEESDDGADDWDEEESRWS